MMGMIAKPQMGFEPLQYITLAFSSMSINATLLIYSTVPVLRTMVVLPLYKLYVDARKQDGKVNSAEYTEL
jgi:hypothetical protein